MSGPVEPTRDPEPLRGEPREGPPEPTTLEETAGDSRLWRKHPSDFHADCAVGALIRANAVDDTLAKANELAVAKVYADLSVRDALLEVAATFKEVARSELAATAELSETMKQAANSIHAAVRESRVKAA